MMSKKGKSLAWYDAHAPVVSIIIANFKNFQHLAGCLDSIWEHTEAYKYEIIIVDNGSGRDELAAIEALGDKLRLIPLRENHFFGDSCNIGARQAKGTYLVFLNNDCRATPNWLQPLVATLESQALCGGVGPKFVFPNGRFQEAGVFIRSDGTSIQNARTYLPFDEEVTKKTHVVDYCSAACFVIKRELFDVLSGFDPIFSPAYYEDVDLAFRIAETGLFVYCCPQSVVLHYLNSTSEKVWTDEQLRRILERNSQLLQKRWRNKLIALANSVSPSPKDFRTGLQSSDAPRSAVQNAIASSHVDVLRDVAALDRRMGYYHAVLSTTVGELDRCRALEQENTVDLRSVRLARSRSINANRADLSERESELEAAGVQLNAQIDALEVKMQKDLAVWLASRVEFEQRSREVSLESRPQ
jgi:GT2 family glycosyltransferase